MNIVQVGVASGVPVCITYDPSVEVLYQSKTPEGILVGAALHVIKKDGTLLSQENVTQVMKVAGLTDDILKFANYCRDHVEALAATFLPAGVTDLVAHPASYDIDRMGNAHVAFLISGLIRK